MYAAIVKKTLRNHFVQTDTQTASSKQAKQISKPTNRDETRITDAALMYLPTNCIGICWRSIQCAADGEGVGLGCGKQCGVEGRLRPVLSEGRSIGAASMRKWIDAFLQFNSKYFVIKRKVRVNYQLFSTFCLFLFLLFVILGALLAYASINAIITIVMTRTNRLRSNALHSYCAHTRLYVKMYVYMCAFMLEWSGCCSVSLATAKVSKIIDFIILWLHFFRNGYLSFRSWLVRDCVGGSGRLRFAFRNLWNNGECVYFNF